MKSESFTTIIIEAEEDKALTQASDEITLRKRVVCSKVALGRNDSADNWKEIPLEEAQAIRAAQEELRLQEHEAIQTEISNNKSEQGI